MRALAAMLAAGLVACCTSSPRPMQDVDPKPGTPGTRGATTDARPTDAPTTDVKETPVPSVQLTFLSRKREHPPLSRVLVDASLRNPGDRARWFLLPSAIGPGHKPIATWAFGVTVWSFVGSGNVVVAEFSSADSFYAIQLPPGADVELRSLQLKLAGEPATDPMSLEVVVADGFTVGGEVPAVWTKSPATCEPRADATQEGARRVLDETMPDMRSLPVEIQGAQRLTVPLSLAK